MKAKLKVLIGAVGLLSAIAAQAYQADIQVNANIDPTASLTLSDGSALPSSVTMNYTPQGGLAAYKNNIKIWSNAALDMNVSLGNDAQLVDSTGNNNIPLTVSLNGTTLTTANSVLNYSKLFPNGIANGSLPLQLIIKQTTPTEAVIAGQYSGTISLIVSQATTKDGSTPSA